VVVEYFTDGIKHLEEINIQEKKDSISLGYASTIFKAQGVSVESVFIALSDNQLLNSAENLNVAISRGKQRCEVFMLAQHEDRIIESHKSDTKAKSDLQNVKQEFFEKERERKILNQNFDIDLDKKYVSPQAKKELEDQKRAYARGVEKMSQRYMVGGHEIEIFTSKGDYFRFLDSRIGEDARKSFVHQFGVIGEINKKLFGSFYTPDGVVSGSFHKADFKMPSPARDHLLGELIKKYQDMELIEGVKVIDSEKLCKNLDALISRPLPEHEKDLEKPLIR
jgi:hypothetical protein